MNWKPIDSAPKDGTAFLASDGRLFEVLNQPPGCEIGVWAQINPGVWSGSSVRHTEPTLWAPLPPPPEGSQQ
jgi:hypothetical protein